MADVGDVALSQAMVCAYAVPIAGAPVAAVLSILQAVYDAEKPDDVPIGQYSASRALADLGKRIGDQIHAAKSDDVLGTIKGWMLAIRDAHLTTPGYAVIGAQAFLTDHDFNKTFGGFFDDDPKSEDRVKSLGNYFIARVAFHSLCQEWLDRLDAGRQFEPMKTATLMTEIHSRYVNSLKDALGYVRETVGMLDETYRTARGKADGKPGTALRGAMPWATPNIIRAHQLRQIRQDAHLEFAPRSDVADFRQWVLLFDTTLAGLLAPSHAAKATVAPTPTTPATTPAPTTVATGGSTISFNGVSTVGAATHVSSTTTVKLTLDPRKPGVARFLYESDPAGGWVDVLADSLVSPGPLVAQDAGSVSAGLYYRIGGDGLNGAFAAQLDKATQLDGEDGANADLVRAYDDLWGDGSYAVDAAGTPPRQDRLTSFLVLLASGVPPIGDTVYGVLYSVGPPLGSTGIQDADAYKKIYTDGLTAIAEWNKTNTPFVNLRLALLSTGIYAGESDGPALRAQAAGLVVDAVVAAMKAMPTLATLTLLVNTNDTPTADGDERIAFETAARARSISTTRQGFDVPLS